jgi:hypothetical protein
MRPIPLLIAGLIALAPLAAWAQVTGVVTSSTATVELRPGVNGPDITTYSGDYLSNSSGDNALGSGGSFASISSVAPGLVKFQNGNAASGDYVYVTSQTDVDITFKNDGAKTVTPTLQSQIAPAGIGVYVGGCNLGALASTCEINAPGAAGETWADFGPSGVDGNDISGATLDFRILAGGRTIYDLKASVTLEYDPATGKNVVVEAVGAARKVLDDFRLISPTGSKSFVGFEWNATDLTVNFPKGLKLKPGQSSTLTYQTTVESFGTTACDVETTTNGCVVAYSSFGDPIGGGGGVKPNVAGLFSSTSDDTGATGVQFGEFAFDAPTFEDGALTLDGLRSIVPEPTVWSLMIVGLGLIGAAMRRRRGAGVFAPKV